MTGWKARWDRSRLVTVCLRCQMPRKSYFRELFSHRNNLSSGVGNSLRCNTVASWHSSRDSRIRSRLILTDDVMMMAVMTYPQAIIRSTGVAYHRHHAVCYRHRLRPPFSYLLVSGIKPLLGRCPNITSVRLNRFALNV